ncbi:gephyrin-like molybdotransferase Glp [Aliiroseovarius sp. PrR006]|uniref:molybdopterin molybdotransferase MoeA n=1 Tax=Aliiroseovarius sp. PrR006 TaxID=2706883 RepID=UPI0013D5EDE6|nr:gephyrin-like molybdotransferase Glp [Aliiroseovarius sp. PrR006]NDW54260.1 molybdopterin molybdotransferase MoeA [Aliiroseovarius sp. PrR006]
MRLKAPEEAMLDKMQDTGCGCDSIKQRLMPLYTAISLAVEGITSVAETEDVTIFHCAGRVAADTVVAAEAMPFFDNSAMDGFAVNTADLLISSRLPISSEIAAGDAPSDLTPGTAARIYTGAPIPSGANAVVMFEMSTVTGEAVEFSIAPRDGDNIRRAGSDQPVGAVLLHPGQRIAARHVGLLAANGIDTCTVRRRIRVGVFSTGDELATRKRRPGQIHDANRPMLMSLCAQMGAEVTDLGTLPDDLEKTTDAFESIRDKFDLVLTSGAVSIGGRDHIREALIAAGGTLDGWRVAIKPGKPIAFGRLGHTIVTGLPGNPFASFVGFHLFAAPQIARLSGVTPAKFATNRASSGFGWARKAGRAEVFPVKLTKHSPEGLPILKRLGASVSATLFPLADADGLAIVPAETDSVAPGDCLYWQPICSAGDVQ